MDFMNKALLASLALASGSLSSYGQISPPSDNVVGPTAPAIVDRDGHRNIWEWTTTYKTEDNETRDVKHRLVQLESGVNRWNGQAWEPSSDQIEITETGGVARGGQHIVYFSGDIADPNGAVSLEMPDGQKLVTRVLGLSFYDSSTGQNALFAELKSAPGELLANGNQVIYRDCFTDVKASIRYTYAKGGFEQDIVLEENPVSPADYGLNPDTTVVEVWTENLNGNSPQNVAKVDGSEDEIVDFGAMHLGAGKAFSIGDSADSVPVRKQWRAFGNRQFLIERVDYPTIEPSLQTLPPAPVVPEVQDPSDEAPSGDNGHAMLHRVNSLRLPPVKSVASVQPRSLKATQVALLDKGYVLDYSALVTATNLTLQGDTTYYITGPVSLSGTTTVESVVVKFASTNSPSITINGPVNWLSSPYRPALFISKDDNSTGESISGSTGTPSGYYAETALNFTTTNQFTLQDIRISNAKTAIAVTGSSYNNLTDVQIANSKVGIAGTNMNVNLRNILLYNVLTNFTSSGSSSTIRAQFLTSDTADTFATVASGVLNFKLTNSLLVSVTNYNSGLFSLVNVYSNANRSGIFQSVGAADHYLADNTYRGIGATVTDTNLVALLRAKTTWSPVVYSNVTVSSALTLYPIVPRDSATNPDIGYHYDALDYAFGGVTASATITFNPGTVVGWFSTPSYGYGINMSDNALVNFSGTLENPCYWVRYNTVQESVNKVWYTGAGPGGILGSATSFANAPEVRARFTKCSLLDGVGVNHFRDNDSRYIRINAVHSEFYGGSLGGYWQTSSYTNCLFDRVYMGVSQGMPTTSLAYRNSTIRGGTFYTQRSYAMPVTIYDCAFDNSVVVTVDAYTNYSSFSNNAFLYGNTNRLYPYATNDVLVTNSFNWQSNTLGFFYQLSTSPLINKGSQTADNAGLFHFTTTQTTPVKETNSVVDIGYHYVALVNGVAADYDSDGIPDYLEDTNGNGAYDSAIDMCNWQDADTDHDGVNDYIEWLQGRNPRASGVVVDTNGIINLNVFTPLK